MGENLIPTELNARLKNFGAYGREIMLEEIEKAFNDGNMQKSIFYQIRYLFDSMQELYLREYSSLKDGSFKEEIKRSVQALKDKSPNPLTPLTQFALETLSDPGIIVNPKPWEEKELKTKSCDFLQNVVSPEEGMNKILQVLTELPEEWTIMQLCKGPNTQTTCSLSEETLENESLIYITLLKHVRSCDYPEPICIQVNTKSNMTANGGNNEAGIFQKFRKLRAEIKKYMMVDIEPIMDSESVRRKYWGDLEKLDDYIQLMVEELKASIFPWRFLFTGRPLTSRVSSQQAQLFKIIDKLCDKYNLSDEQRVLLSLAALNGRVRLTVDEVDAICSILVKAAEPRRQAKQILLSVSKEASISKANPKSSCKRDHFPLILVLSERLDYFFWEEMNTEQEITRVNSLQALYRLYVAYKDQIENGYLKVNITDGAALINPDGNLPKMEKRMRAFFEHWMPEDKWSFKVGEKPTQTELLNDFLGRKCYVYAGHGSGLQHINGKHISKEKVSAVVFLFGCDSLCMNSMGLHSDLIGSHIYYHAALCPTIVGTLIPALDSMMDRICVDLLSRWVAPKSKDILHIEEIDLKAWAKEGVIRANQSQSKQRSEPYQEGSLCSLVARIHRRIVDKYFYNTVSYVCRGLPAWNCGVQDPSVILKASKEEST